MDDPPMPPLWPSSSVREPFSTAPFDSILGHLPLRETDRYRIPCHHENRGHGQLGTRVPAPGHAEPASRFSVGYYETHWFGLTSRIEDLRAASTSTTLHDLPQHPCPPQFQSQSLPQPQIQSALMSGCIRSNPLSAASNFASWARDLPSPPVQSWQRTQGQAGIGELSSTGGTMGACGAMSLYQTAAGQESGSYAGWKTDQSGSKLGDLPDMELYQNMVEENRVSTERSLMNTAIPAVPLDQFTQTVSDTVTPDLLSSEPLPLVDAVHAATMALAQSRANTSPIGPLMTSVPAARPVQSTVPAPVIPDKQKQTRKRAVKRSARRTHASAPSSAPYNQTAFRAYPYQSSVAHSLSEPQATTRWNDVSTPGVLFAQLPDTAETSSLVQLATQSSPSTSRRSTRRNVHERRITRTNYTVDGRDCLDPFPHGLYGSKRWKSNVAAESPGSQGSGQTLVIEINPSVIQPTDVQSTAPSPISTLQRGCETEEPSMGPSSSQAAGDPVVDGHLVTIAPYLDLGDFIQEPLKCNDVTTHKTEIDTADLGFTPSENMVDHSAAWKPTADTPGIGTLREWESDTMPRSWDDPAMLYQLTMLHASKGKGEKVSFGGKSSRSPLQQATCRCDLHIPDTDLASAYIQQPTAGTLSHDLSDLSSQANANPTPGGSVLDSQTVSSFSPGSWSGADVSAGYWPGDGNTFPEHVSTLTDGSSVETSWTCPTPWTRDNTDLFLPQYGPTEISLNTNAKGPFNPDPGLLVGKEVEYPEILGLDTSLMLPDEGICLDPSFMKQSEQVRTAIPHDIHFTAISSPVRFDTLAFPNQDWTVFGFAPIQNLLPSHGPSVVHAGATHCVDRDIWPGSPAARECAETSTTTKSRVCMNCKTTWTKQWMGGPANEVLCSPCGLAWQHIGDRQRGKQVNVHDEPQDCQEHDPLGVDTPPQSTRQGFYQMDEFSSRSLSQNTRYAAPVESEKRNGPPLADKTTPQRGSSVATPNLIPAVRISSRRAAQPPGAGVQPPRGGKALPLAKAEGRVDSLDPIEDANPMIRGSAKSAPASSVAPANPEDPPVGALRTRAKRSRPGSSASLDKPVPAPKKQRKKKATKAEDNDQEYQPAKSKSATAKQ